VGRTYRQLCSIITERHRPTKIVRAVKRDIDVPRTYIARANGAGLYAATKTGIAKTKEMNRTGVIRGIIETTVIACTHCQARPVGVQCDRKAKQIGRIQRRDIDITHTGVTSAHGANFLATTKCGVAKGKQMHRA